VDDRVLEIVELGLPMYGSLGLGTIEFGEMEEPTLTLFRGCHRFGTGLYVGGLGSDLGSVRRRGGSRLRGFRGGRVVFAIDDGEFLRCLMFEMLYLDGTVFLGRTVAFAVGILVEVLGIEAERRWR
jgi:hypothetical protein